MKRYLITAALIAALVVCLIFPKPDAANATGTVCSYTSGTTLADTDYFSLSRNCGGTYKLAATAWQTYLIEDTTTNGTTTKAPSSNAVFDALALKLNKAGTATNDDAAAGAIGEVASTVVATGSAVSLATGTAKTVASVSLTAGDWEVTGVIDFKPAATTTATYLQSGISATNNTTGAQDSFTQLTAAVPAGGPDPAIPTPTIRVSIGSTTTYYLVGKAAFAVDTLGAYGTIRARRVR